MFVIHGQIFRHTSSLLPSPITASNPYAFSTRSYSVTTCCTTTGHTFLPAAPLASQKLASLPPNPNVAPTGRCSHFGAFFRGEEFGATGVHANTLHKLTRECRSPAENWPYVAWDHCTRANAPPVFASGCHVSAIFSVDDVSQRITLPSRAVERSNEAS